MAGVTPVVIEEEPERKGISFQALWEADVTGAPIVDASKIFARPIPMRGVLPTSLAMDGAGLPACLPSMGAITNWATMGAFHEGLAFPGYPYLAELAQRLEYRHVASIWAEHATRKWIEIKGPEDKVAELDAFLKKLNARACFREVAEYDMLMGRAQIFMDCDDYDNPQELMTALIAVQAKVSKRHPIVRIRVVEPMWSYPGPYETTNPLSPYFYKPQHWYVYGKEISDTRLLTFVGMEMPDMLKPAYAFGGMSMTQAIKPYVDNWLRGRQSASDLLNAFSTMVFATDMSSVLTGGSANNLNTRLTLQSKQRSNRGIWVIDKGAEELTNVAVPLSGVSDMVSQAQQQMASAARIPLSILLQVTPSGLNASSEGETRSFYADVNAYQEKVFRPNLERLFDYAQLSLWDEIDPEISFMFPSLWEMTAKEVAEVNDLEAKTDAAYVAAGIVSAEEARDRIQSDETNLYHGVDLSGEPPHEADDQTGDPADDPVEEMK